MPIQVSLECDNRRQQDTFLIQQNNCEFALRSADGPTPLKIFPSPLRTQHNKTPLLSDDREPAAMAGSTHQVERPMSIKEITAKAQDFIFDVSVPPNYWLRTGETLMRQVRVEYNKGDIF